MGDYSLSHPFRLLRYKVQKIVQNTITFLNKKRYRGFLLETHEIQQTNNGKCRKERKKLE